MTSSARCQNCILIALAALLLGFAWSADATVVVDADVENDGDWTGAGFVWDCSFPQVTPSCQEGLVAATMDSSGSISQTFTGVPLQPGSYTVEFAVGDYNNFPFPGLQVDFSGHPRSAVVQATAPVPSPGTWEVWSLTWNILAGDPNIGNDISLTVSVPANPTTNAAFDGLGTLSPSGSGVVISYDPGYVSSGPISGNFEGVVVSNTIPLVLNTAVRVTGSLAISSSVVDTCPGAGCGSFPVDIAPTIVTFYDQFDNVVWSGSDASSTFDLASGAASVGFQGDNPGGSGFAIGALHGPLGYTNADDLDSLILPLVDPTGWQVDICAGFILSCDPSWNAVFDVTQINVIRTDLAACAVAAGGSSGCDTLGGLTSRGGVQAAFDQVLTPGTFTAELCEVPAQEVQNGNLSDPFCGQDPGNLTFALPTDPALFWDLGFDGTFSGPITLTFAYGDVPFATGFNENNFTVWHDATAMGAWGELTASVDTVARTITVTTTSLSPFALGGVTAPVPMMSRWLLALVVAAMAALLVRAQLRRRSRSLADQDSNP